MKKNVGWIVTVVILSIMLILSMVFNATGLSTVSKSDSTPVPAEIQATKTPVATFTPDPCAPNNIEEEIARIHSFTREFEDTAKLLTSTLLSSSSVALVQDLQRIRRAAEDQVVPSCLVDLKAYQITHMNARIDVFGTALAFVNIYGPNGDQNTLNQTLAPLWPKEEAAARQYENEYYRLLGITPTPVPTLDVIITPSS